MNDDDSLPDYYSDDKPPEGQNVKSGKLLSLKLVFLTLISAVAYSLVGNTFAANVQLGSGRVEFGQGVLTSTACDSQLIVTPFATFANASGVSAKYKLTDIQLSDISTSCYGRDFIIKAYDSATATPLNLYQVGGSTSYNSLRIYNNNGIFTLADSGLTQAQINAVTSGFKVTLLMVHLQLLPPQQKLRQSFALQSNQCRTMEPSRRPLDRAEVSSSQVGWGLDPLTMHQITLSH